ncbi:tRNA (adenosine(37)-N6)-threonylcarbamoyltransferase complex ATPase subunit type 1 TsaE, partial [Streptomyces lasiicapitis]|uniref:tRNA (adenosine(37)-N6)-threonylcarbamoyltransferase complex ATPase subunit type 1 TsaE n=1 Tax=Streptomyces lasiicapitis TaxID=1923961 RepID=UPI0036BB4769
MEAPHSPAPAVSLQLTVNSPQQMGELGRRLAKILRPGDLVMLTGELGAGKTTLTRGLGEGLGVRGAVTSPTFVIARVHPSRGDGPPRVHVGAVPLGGGLDGLGGQELDR